MEMAHFMNSIPIKCVYHSVHEEYQGPDNAISKRSYIVVASWKVLMKLGIHIMAKHSWSVYKRFANELWQEYYYTGGLSSEGSYLKVKAWTMEILL